MSTWAHIDQMVYSVCKKTEKEHNWAHKEKPQGSPVLLGSLSPDPSSPCLQAGL